MVSDSDPSSIDFEDAAAGQSHGRGTTGGKQTTY